MRVIASASQPLLQGWACTACLTTSKGIVATWQTGAHCQSCTKLHTRRLRQRRSPEELQVIWWGQSVMQNPSLSTFGRQTGVTSVRGLCLKAVPKTACQDRKWVCKYERKAGLSLSFRDQLLCRLQALQPRTWKELRHVDHPQVVDNNTAIGAKLHIRPFSKTASRSVCRASPPPA